jgi:hypothetical protein
MAFAVLALIGCGGAQSDHPAADPTTTSEQTSVSPCRSDPHEGVHDPTRLKILDQCATFVGTVIRAPKLNRNDGDVTFNAAPDPAYTSMLNDKNRANGGIHIEIVPMDQPGCTPGEPIQGPLKNLGVCSGANVIFPPLGAHVRVVGPHVYDQWVGWNEIHPAWKIEILPPTGPLPPEVLVLNARLTGKAVGKRGAPRGSGRVTLLLTAGKACWRFTRLAGIGTPTRATIRAGAPHRTGPVVLRLGTRYRARGCVTADEEVLNSLGEKPGFHYVTVATVRYRLGAIRGQLTPASD